MAEDIQPEARSAIQIGFKSKRFFLPLPNADKPLEGDGAGSQSYRDSGIIEPVRDEAESRLEKSYSQPTRLEESAAVGACRFHPTQCQGTFFAVIAGKVEKPHRQQDSRTERVDEHQASHRTSNCEYYDL